MVALCQGVAEIRADDIIVLSYNEEKVVLIERVCEVSTWNQVEFDFLSMQ